MIATRPAFALCLPLLLLAACSGQQVSHNLGLSRDSPDEFQVTTRAPLAMPTDYTLVPPQPGAPRPQEPAAALAAEAALAPSVELNNRTGQITPGQTALLASAGPTPPDGIRQTVDAEAPRVNSHTGVTNTLAFWRSTPPPGTPIDPVKEAARLRAIGIPTLSVAGAAP